MAGTVGVPNLAAWRAQEDWNEEEDGVKNGIQDNEGLSKPPPQVSLNGQEYTEDQQHDGYLGHCERYGVDDILVI